MTAAASAPDLDRVDGEPLPVWNDLQDQVIGACRRRAQLWWGLTRYFGIGFMLSGVRTSELAEQAGVNMQTLRYYERRGILPDPPRSPAGYRDYPAAAVSMLRFVKRAQRLGFTLAEVEELLGLAEGGPESCETARSLAEAHIAALEAKVADLQRMRASLATLVDTCRRPRADRSCPLLAALEGDVPLPAVSS